MPRNPTTGDVAVHSNTTSASRAPLGAQRASRAPLQHAATACQRARAWCCSSQPALRAAAARAQAHRTRPPTPRNVHAAACTPRTPGGCERPTPAMHHEPMGTTRQIKHRVARGRTRLAILSGTGVSGSVSASVRVSTISAPASALSSANTMAALMSARSTFGGGDTNKQLRRQHLQAAPRPPPHQVAQQCPTPAFWGLLYMKTHLSQVRAPSP